jgi:hypothetical protein
MVGGTKKQLKPSNFSTFLLQVTLCPGTPRLDSLVERLATSKTTLLTNADLRKMAVF